MWHCVVAVNRKTLRWIITRKNVPSHYPILKAWCSRLSCQLDQACKFRTMNTSKYSKNPQRANLQPIYRQLSILPPQSSSKMTNSTKVYWKRSKQKKKAHLSRSPLGQSRPTKPMVKRWAKCEAIKTPLFNRAWPLGSIWMILGRFSSRIILTRMTLASLRPSQQMQVVVTKRNSSANQD